MFVIRFGVQPPGWLRMARWINERRYVGMWQRWDEMIDGRGKGSEGATRVKTTDP